MSEYYYPGTILPVAFEYPPADWITVMPAENRVSLCDRKQAVQSGRGLQVKFARCVDYYRPYLSRVTSPAKPGSFTKTWAEIRCSSSLHVGQLL